MRLVSRIVMTAALLTVTAAAPADAGDGLDELARAVARFRGVGDASVVSYRVTVELPDDPDTDAVPLREIWRAPADLALRATKPGTPTAIVRGLAIYLEPLYVARASLLGADLHASVERLRASCRVESEAAGGGTRVLVEFPAAPDELLPVELRDLGRLEARVDRNDRLERLDVETRDGDGIVLECSYDDGRQPQPSLARWSLPNGDRVEIRTVFRNENGRTLPESRHVVFPSRYDPGDTEELLVHYEDWELDVDLPAGIFRARDSFRYDSNGLVAD